MKKSFLSFLVFFGTFATLTIGYAMWNSPLTMSTVWSGSGLTANGWNALVNNLNDINNRLASAEVTITNLSASWAVMAFNRTTCPTGWSTADGSGGRPDLRGEFIRGLDSGRGVDSGRILGSSQGDIFASHTHNIRSWPHTGGYDYPQLPVAGNIGYPQNGIGESSMVFTFNEGQRVIPYGTFYNTSSGGLETRPRNIALLYCVKN